MDSFERSMQISTEVKLDGETEELNDKRENPRDLRAVALRNSELRNGLEKYMGHVSFDDIKEGEFGDIQTNLENLELQKSKYR